VQQSADDAVARCAGRIFEWISSIKGISDHEAFAQFFSPDAITAAINHGPSKSGTGTASVYCCPCGGRITVMKDSKFVMKQRDFVSSHQAHWQTSMHSTFIGAVSVCIVWLLLYAVSGYLYRCLC